MSAFPGQHQRSDRTSFPEIRPMIPARGSGTLPTMFPALPTHGHHVMPAMSLHSSPQSSSSVFPAAGSQHPPGASHARHRTASTASPQPAFIKRKSDVGHSSTKWHLRLVQQQQQQYNQQQFAPSSPPNMVQYDSPGRRSLSARISMSDVRSFSDYGQYSQPLYTFQFFSCPPLF